MKTFLLISFLFVSSQSFADRCEDVLSFELKKINKSKLSKTEKFQDLKEYLRKKEEVESGEQTDQSTSELQNLNQEYGMNDVKYKFILNKKYYNKIVSYESVAEAYYSDQKMLAYHFHYPLFEKIVFLSEDCRIEKVSVWKKNSHREKIQITPGLCKDLSNIKQLTLTIKDEFVPRCFEVGGIPMENQRPVVCKCPTFTFIDPWFETCSATDRVFKRRNKHILEDFVIDHGAIWDYYDESNYFFADELCKQHKKDLFI
ncbi:MAG: hypothetical protein AB7I27_18065 [Bacteriovoracaceae bacterium]